MTSEEIIVGRLIEVEKLAEAFGDNNTRIVLRALLGAKAIGLDARLAARVQDFIKDVLLPETIRMKEEDRVSKN
jgi:hypothetical protein